MRIIRSISFLLGLGLLSVLMFGAYLAVKGSPILQQTAPNPYVGKTIYLPIIMKGITLPPAPNSPPLSTDSYYFYMRYYTDEKARAAGCNLGKHDLNLAGKQDNLVILDFGITKYEDVQYGASGMQIGGFYTMSQIAKAVQEFGLGYWVCTESDYSSHLTIGIGTNNYNDSDTFSNLSVTYGHGREWAKMVNSVGSYFTNTCYGGCNGQISIMGANDIELAWSSPQAAIDWLDGYDSVNNYPLINFGAAEGCPNFCGSREYTWTKAQAWRVQNSGPVYALPEIYLNSGVHANQWYQMSQYAFQAYGRPYDFIGVMTQYGACQQYPDDTCPVLDNTPEEGWQQLYDRVNGSNMNTWDSIPYATDIRWWEDE